MKCERGDFRPKRFHAGTIQDFKEVLNKLAHRGCEDDPHIANTKLIYCYYYLYGIDHTRIHKHAVFLMTLR